MYLKCIYYREKSGDYCCEVTMSPVVKYRHGTEIQSFRGKHEAKMGHQDVDTFTFSFATITYFPRGIDSHFPHLKSVTLSNCRLKSICRQDLEDFTWLEFLNLENNRLISLPDDLFVGLINLRWIYFNGNFIKYMSSEILRPLQRNDLKFIDFRFNSKINNVYRSNSIYTLRSLMEAIDKKCLPFNKMKYSKANDPCFGKLLKFHASGKFSDFAINFRKKRYNVHRNIFAAQSPVFEKMFNDDIFTPLKVLKNYNNQTVSDFFEFFYTGVLRSRSNARHFLKLATEFQMEHLKSVCVERLLDDLTERNALELYNVGLECKSQELSYVAFQEVKRNCDKIYDNMIDDPELVNKIVEVNERIDRMFDTYKLWKE